MTVTKPFSRNRVKQLFDPTAIKDRFYNVTVIKNGEKINSTDLAYKQFLQNWDKDFMNSVKEYRTFVLDMHDNPMYMISFEVINNVDDAQVNNLFNIASQIPNASKLIIGKNSPGESVIPTQEERHIAKQFKACGEYINLPVTEQLKMTPDAVYAFDQKSLSKPNKLSTCSF